ncbi:muconate cycloisomerase, partial [Rhodococcus wratislaviensis IFP 2016]
HGWRVRPVSAADVRPIRHTVLRPGQPAETCVYPEDAHVGTRHFATLVAGRPIGVASLYHEDPPEAHAVPGLLPGRGWRLRGMATLEEVRGTGAGTTLLRTVLTNAALAGADAVWCNARTTAAGFYVKQGFRILGPEFDIPGIGPHVFMHWSTS